VLVNAGCANACTGERGLRDAEQMTALAAQQLHSATEQVLVASTGIIGHFLPMDLIQPGIINACQSLSPTGGIDAAHAIMTTDLKAKHFAVEFELDGKRCRIGGIAKGSGMINPCLATMICVITTDVHIDGSLLHAALTQAADKSLNSLTVDGETSTNDVVFLLANGKSGNKKIIAKTEQFEIFTDALTKLSVALAQSIARDGEGASKLVTVIVQGARDAAEAQKAAKAIANSMLVKTAIFGQDPNWGRVVSAVGATGIGIRLDKLSVQYGGISVFTNGCAREYDQQHMHQAMAQTELDIQVCLGAGEACATVYTCDLTHGYISINADYHT
jgi:glutamate N-acetyltransferase/amino-acid N-acetyltransferase